jgi:hypothetical protein
MGNIFKSEEARERRESVPHGGDVERRGTTRADDGGVNPLANITERSAA